MPLLLFTPYFSGSEAADMRVGCVDWTVGSSFVTVSATIHVFVSPPGGQRTFTNIYSANILAPGPGSRFIL